MKPHEILQKIIDEKGSCDWINAPTDDICNKCPFGGAVVCTEFVNKRTGSFSNAEYLEVAKKTLADIEADRIILGEKLEK